jgi:hypothetical protein
MAHTDEMAVVISDASRLRSQHQQQDQQQQEQWWWHQQNELETQQQDLWHALPALTELFVDPSPQWLSLGFFVTTLALVTFNQVRST